MTDLERALALWQATRHPPLFGVVGRLGDRVKVEASLRGGPREEEHRAWMAVPGAAMLEM